MVTPTSRHPWFYRTQNSPVWLSSGSESGRNSISSYGADNEEDNHDSVSNSGASDKEGGREGGDEGQEWFEGDGGGGGVWYDDDGAGLGLGSGSDLGGGNDPLGSDSGALPAKRKLAAALGGIMRGDRQVARKQPDSDGDEVRDDDFDDDGFDPTDLDTMYTVKRFVGKENTDARFPPLGGIESPDWLQCDTSNVDNIPVSKLDVDALLICGSVSLLSAVLSPMAVSLANHAKVPDFARTRGFDDGSLYDWLCLVDGEPRI